MAIVMLHETPDEQLMGAVALGDQGAFSLLVRRHLPRAYAIARRTLNDATQAEDAAQEAFNKVWTHARDFDAGRAKFTTWLHRIVVNASLDMVRRRREITGQDAVFDAQVETRADAEAQLSQHQSARAVRDAVGELTPQQRAAVALCYFEEYSNEEAARMMGVNLKALEGLLVRARKALKVKLKAVKEQRDAA